MRRLPALHRWLRLCRHRARCVGRPRREMRHVRRRAFLCLRVPDRGAAPHHDRAHLQRGWRLGGYVRSGAGRLPGLQHRTVDAPHHAPRRPGQPCWRRRRAACRAWVRSATTASTGTKVPVFHPLLTNTAAMLAGVKRQLKRKGREVTAIAIAGDGGASDVGFQSLSGAAERGEEILVHGGRQRGLHEYRHAALELHALWRMDVDDARRTEDQKARRRTRRTCPCLMVNHRCAYVATASTAFMEDLYDKLDKAIVASRSGFAYLHVYSPCTTGWRFPTDQNMEVARKAVETNFVMLWEFCPGDGLRFTHPVDAPLPVTDYLKAMGRFRHLRRRPDPTHSGESRREPRHHRTNRDETERGVIRATTNVQRRRNTAGTK